MADIDPRLRALEQLLGDLQSEAAAHDTDLLQRTAARGYQCLCKDTIQEFEYLSEAAKGLLNVSDEIVREVVFTGLIVRTYGVMERYFKSLVLLLFHCREIEGHVVNDTDVAVLALSARQLRTLNRNANTAAREYREVHWGRAIENLTLLGVAVQLQRETGDRLQRVRLLRNQLAHGKAAFLEFEDGTRTPALQTDFASDTDLTSSSLPIKPTSSRFLSL